jgi:hypothetical protein
MRKTRPDTYHHHLETNYVHPNISSSACVPVEYDTDIPSHHDYPPAQNGSSRLPVTDYPRGYSYAIGASDCYTEAPHYEDSSYLNSGRLSAHSVYNQPGGAYSRFDTPVLPRRTPHPTPALSLGYIPHPHPGPQSLINRSGITADSSARQDWLPHNAITPHPKSSMTGERVHELDDLDQGSLEMPITHAAQWPAPTGSEKATGDTSIPGPSNDQLYSLAINRDANSTVSFAGGYRTKATEACQTIEGLRNESLSPLGSPSPRTSPDRIGKTKDRRQPKMHECPECQRKFPRPSGLKVHIDSHKGLRPYACQFPGCTRKFTANSNSRRHFRTHFKGQQPPANLISPRERASIDFEKPIVSPHRIPPLAGPYPLQWVSESGLGESKSSLHGSH